MLDADEFNFEAMPNEQAFHENFYARHLQAI